MSLRSDDLNSVGELYAENEFRQLVVASRQRQLFSATSASLKIMASAILLERRPLVPTNWVPIPGQEPGRPAMANILHQAAAHSNSLFIACADRVGTERGQPFEGQSVIVNCTGWLVAGPASRDREEIIYGRVDLADARRKRNWNEFNQVLRDRRTDVYDEMLGSQLKRGWY